MYFLSSAAASEYKYYLDPLFAEIVPSESKYKVYSTKLEITLKKKDANKWPELEKQAVEGVTDNQDKDKKVDPSELVYPTSSKKKINWNNFKIDDDDKEEGNENDFSGKYSKMLTKILEER